MGGVYLAYPIDQANKFLTLGKINDIRSALGGSEHVAWVYDPGRSFSMGQQGTSKDHRLRSINRRALKEASAVVALLPAGVPTIGVPMEIERALSMGKPVLVISDAPSWMLQFEPDENARLVGCWSNNALSWIEHHLETGPDVGNDYSFQHPLPVMANQDNLVPRRGYADDAGLDLIVERSVVVPVDSFVDIPCGVSVQLPDWSWGMITGRSSTLRKLGLLVNQGIIDAGYRGPLFAGVWNMTDHEITIDSGARIAQLIVLENATRRLRVKAVDELEPSERGSNGFGSTGY